MNASTLTFASTSRSGAGLSLTVILAIALSGCCGPCFAPCNQSATAPPPPPPISETLLEQLSLSLTPAQVESILGPPEHSYTFSCAHDARVHGEALRFSTTSGKTAVVFFGGGHLITSVVVVSSSLERSQLLGADPCPAR